MLYIAYLDEFGHLGPFVSKDDPKYNTSPVFGLGGIVLPSDSVREFATWFFKLKCDLLKFEIERDGIPPFRWEKKGSALLTTRNITSYKQVRLAINRILNKVEAGGGFVFFQGFTKMHSPENSSSEQLYSEILRRSITKLNKHCASVQSQFMMVLDESDFRFHREVIIPKASLTMFGKEYCDRLIEPPFQVASHLYQTVQCADWICGLLGRLGAYNADPIAYVDLAWAKTYFEARLERVAKRSAIRSREGALQATARWRSEQIAPTPQVERVETSACLGADPQR